MITENYGRSYEAFLKFGPALLVSGVDFSTIANSCDPGLVRD